MKLNAEWISYINAYRLYDPDRPQDTIAYNNDLGDEWKRAKAEGYDGIILEQGRDFKMKFTGKKAASGATKKYCSRNGYENKIQIIYNRQTDRISWYQSIGNSYMQFDNVNLVSIFISKPATMEEIVNRLEDRIAEIDAMDKYINAEM